MLRSQTNGGVFALPSFEVQFTLGKVGKEARNVLAAESCHAYAFTSKNLRLRENVQNKWRLTVRLGCHPWISRSDPLLWPL